MHFFFRTNFNRNIGLGHIIRSLRLFNELKKNNICKIYIDKYDESISNLIPKIICEELYKKKKFNSQIEDAKLFLSKIKKFKKGYVVIDDYRLDATWEKILSDNNFKIITLDDLENRAHYADFIINYDTQYLDKKEYSFKLNKKKDGRYLLGPRYCILPKIPTLKKIKRKNTSFFITMYMGGGGNLLAISHLIKQLQKKIKKNIFINVIIGPLSKNKNLIIKLCENNKNIIPIENCANLIDIYRKSDLFIGAAGTSVFETAVTKLPSILISIAKNQMTNVLSLEKIGHYFFLKNSEIKDIKKLSELIYIMTREYKRVEFLTKSAESKINDKGIKNIKQAILDKKSRKKNIIQNKTSDKKKNLVVRSVNDTDINDYLISRNLPMNVNHSSNKKEILAIDHYIWWFKNNRKSYVLLKKGKKILYFYEQKIFTILNKDFYISGWFACSKECSIKEIIFALNWQRYQKKHINWVSFIKKNNKLSIYLSKYLGWKIMKKTSSALEKLKLAFKINEKKFIFYERT